MASTHHWLTYPQGMYETKRGSDGKNASSSSEGHKLVKMARAYKERGKWWSVTVVVVSCSTLDHAV